VKVNVAFGKPCFVCDGRSHFAKMCSQHTRKVHKVIPLSAPAESPTRNTGNDGSTDTELFVGELEINSVDGKACYSKLVDFKMDTGAEANITPRQIYDLLQLPGNLEQSSEVLLS